MFYDDAFQRITETTAFSEEATFSVSSEEYSVKGFFCSGSYGEKDFDKGYSVRKTVKRQSLKVSASSLPSGVTPQDLIRNTLTIRGNAYIVREITGNESGILNLDLIAGGASA